MDYIEYLCAKKRGLTREGLLQDILSSFLELKRKGYSNTEYNTEIDNQDGTVTELKVIIKTVKK